MELRRSAGLIERRWLPARAFALAAVEYRAPEGALPVCVFDAKRRVQLPAIVASK
jgi:hypothetical protein